MAAKKAIFLYAVVIVVALMTVKVIGVPFDLDRMTAEEKASISELRKLVENEQTVGYMREDIYLAKWLAANNFDLKVAHHKLQKHLDWMQKEKIYKILEENWQEMNAAFPYTIDTKDRMGRPLLYFSLGQWNIYKLYAEKGSLDSLGRYFVKMLEESNAQVRQLRAQGENITQFSLIINMNEFSSEKHGCLECLYFYRNIASILLAHFPRATERKVLVNVPPFFEIVYAFLSEETQKLLQVFGRDRDVWGPVLLEYIERNQIPKGLLSNDYIPPGNNSTLNSSPR